MMHPRFRKVSYSLTLVLASTLLLSGCMADTQTFIKLASALKPKVNSPAVLGSSSPPENAAVQLPPEQTVTTYTWEDLGTDSQGRQLFRVRILSGGNPAQVALDRLTPLFSADGKDAPQYVSDAFFAANPNRKPNTIQPGDQFTLTLPADAFVVRSQSEGDEQLGQTAKVRTYVSTRGDVLRYYLTDPFPILYELDSASNPGHGQLHLSPDLAFLLNTGRTNAGSLAQLIYRVNDPDIFEVEAARSLAASAQLGVEKVIDVDRTRTYMDPVREAMADSTTVEHVDDPARSFLTRYLPADNQGAPFMAVEDALGNRTSLAGLPAGRVFRIAYDWDGTVHVYYITGPDDQLGKRDPYAQREDERWAALYQRLQPDADTPVKWGPGEASDLEPFPSARDPRQKDSSSEHAYDYLLSGRALVLTFHPIRAQSDVQAEEQLRSAMLDAREQYKEPISGALQILDQLHPSGAPDAGGSSSPTGDSSNGDDGT